jgi:carbon storage regulator
MLVLTRKIGERIVIADSIFIQVLEAKGQRIRLGVEAPPDVRIWREELAETPASYPVGEWTASLDR